MGYITRQQAAERLSICVKTLDRLIARGQIAAYKVGERLVRLDEKDIEDYKKRRAEGVEPPPYGTEDIVKALRCTSTPWGGKDETETCRDCPYLTKEVAPEELKFAANKTDGMLWNCDCDRIALDAADRLEELSSADLISRKALEDFAMSCVGGTVTMQQIHEFPAAGMREHGRTR